MPNFTYNKRLGVKNVEGRACRPGSVNAGKVFPWFTKEEDGQSKVACFPDQWEGEWQNMETLPPEITDVGYVGQ